jgi:hypothetical protein
MIFDLAVANRNELISSGAALTEEDLADLYSNQRVAELVREVNPAHMPYLFPEVFLREVPGFDCIVGNPPWERPVMDKARFWASKAPGLMSLPVQHRDKKIIELESTRAGDFTEYSDALATLEASRQVLRKRFDLGVGDTDLYKAFGWVALELLKGKAGRLGFVLPKTAFSAAGLAGWRRALQSKGSIEHLTFIVNSGQWAFPIHPQYSIALVSFATTPNLDLHLFGPVHSREEFAALGDKPAVILPKDSSLNFTESASIPVLKDQHTADILVKMRTSPNLKDWEGGKFRTVNDFHATADRSTFDHGPGPGRWPVFAGKTFNIWEPDFGVLFAEADPEIALAELKNKLLRQQKLKSSAFFGLSISKDLNGHHPAEGPRIAYRSVTNPTNSRTIIPALIPPRTFLTHITPYLFTPPGNEKLEALLLGVMSSIPFDWYARKFVESAVDVHLINAFPVPKFDNLDLRNEVVLLAAKLAAVDVRYQEWASSIGLEVGKLSNSQDRRRAISRLDGLVAAAYGLASLDLEHIFSTFHRGWSDPARLDLALEALEEYPQ